ncbi:alpha,alpha-trehalose-phosphate synthase [Artemisia annua]|uniref:Alpha,alpha-trehalose-phosphate synthase n=1 Tax=Artemisia annua TaxID=35608 RepID=A0A2U1MEE3_ARTAN|nr:alpha,alpha-trehalose-phosphate synthase [Artemisia annua]
MCKFLQLFQKAKVYLLLQWRLLASIAVAHDVIYIVLQVENSVVGAPCGVMDHMASTRGEANKLLAMVCKCIRFLKDAVPTRTNVPEYQKLTSHVHEIVGRINGRFGTLTVVPIHHLVGEIKDKTNQELGNLDSRIRYARREHGHTHGRVEDIERTL